MIAARFGRRGALLAGIVLLVTRTALAQNAAQPIVHRIELSGGGGVFSGTGLGGGDANLRANTTTGSNYRLFTTQSRLATTPFVEARVGTAVSRRLAVEGTFRYGRPELRTSVSGDVEGAAALTVVERIDQYTIDAGVLVMIDELRVAGMMPFIAAGAGYLRQLHEGRSVVEQGHTFHVGGGVRRPLFRRDRRLVKAAGLRGDARLDLFSGGVAFDNRLRAHAALSGAFFVTF